MIYLDELDLGRLREDLRYLKKRTGEEWKLSPRPQDDTWLLYCTYNNIVVHVGKKDEFKRFEYQANERWHRSLGEACTEMIETTRERFAHVRQNMEGLQKFLDRCDR
jgi:hypothetical protein